MDNSENKPETPTKPQIKSKNRSLRIVVYLVLAHGLILIALDWAAAQNAYYVAGQTAGRMFWLIIVTWALIKTVKTGWGVGILYITVMLTAQSLQVAVLWGEPGLAVEEKVVETVLIALINSLLVVALGFLIRRESRDAFKKHRSPASDKSA